MRMFEKEGKRGREGRRARLRERKKSMIQKGSRERAEEEKTMEERRKCIYIGVKGRKSEMEEEDIGDTVSQVRSYTHTHPERRRDGRKEE